MYPFVPLTAVAEEYRGGWRGTARRGGDAAGTEHMIRSRHQSDDPNPHVHTPVINTDTLEIVDKEIKRVAKAN